MSSNLDRRSFIKEGVIFGFTALLAPSVLLNQGCALVPHAPKIWKAMKVLGGLASTIAILDYLNIKPDFSKLFSFREASQCLPEFKKDKEVMTRNGLDVFVGINRSPLLRDVAVMIGTTTTKSNIKISLQLKGEPSIKAANGELSAIHAASEFIKEHYKFPKNELAKAVTLVNRQDILIPDENTGTNILVTRFTNDLGGEILYNPRPTGDFKQYLGGTVQLYQPNYTDPEAKPFLALSI